MSVRIEELEQALIAADKAGNVADATRLARAVVTMRSSQHTPVSPTDGMSGPQKFVAGMGKGFMDIRRGADQMLGVGEDPTENRKMDAPLMDTGAGMAGSIAAQTLPAAAAMFVPGANSIPGAALVSGVMGALQPVGKDESRDANILTSAALGGGAQAGIGKLAGWAGQRLVAAEAEGAASAAKNAVKDATLQGSREAGYVVPPSLSSGGLPGRMMEGLSGKVKTQQAAAIKNQNVTEGLARKAMGMADDAPITAEAMQGIRNAAFESGYAPVSKVGVFETDRTYLKTLDSIAADYKGAARSFGKAVPDEVAQMVDSLKVGAMDAGDAIKMTRILREDASKAFASGDKALGKATRKASNAIEDQIERGLEAAGKDGQAMLKEFRAARVTMAKAHNVEDAIRKGGAVDARVFGKMLQKGKPLSDELKTIGLFANNFPEVAAIPKAGWSNPVTALDAFGAAGMAGMGAGPMAVALPAARLAARKGALAMQGAPNYGPGLLSRLSPRALEELRRTGGLLGSVGAPQQ